MMREIRAARIILYANRRDELGNHHHIMWVMVGNVAACKNDDDDDERYKSGNLSNYYSSLFLFLRMWSFSCRWLSHANPPIVVVANSFLYEREREEISEEEHFSYFLLLFFCALAASISAKKERECFLLVEGETFCQIIFCPLMCVINVNYATYF